MKNLPWTKKEAELWIGALQATPDLPTSPIVRDPISPFSVIGGSNPTGILISMATPKGDINMFLNPYVAEVLQALLERLINDAGWRGDDGMIRIPDH